MAPTTENKSAKLLQIALLIACGVLLLALIVVSAFAYQWHDENSDLKQSNMTLRALADSSTLDSLTSEVSTLQADLLEAESKVTEYEKLIAEYETILTENDLMPEDESAE